MFNDFKKGFFVTLGGVAAVALSAVVADKITGNDKKKTEKSEDKESE